MAVAHLISIQYSLRSEYLPSMVLLNGFFMEEFHCVAPMFIAFQFEV
jgi:hypothetical protein